MLFTRTAVFESINLVFSGVSGGLVGGGRVLGVLGDTLVLDVSDEAGVAIDLVGHDLSATVGKSDAVRAGHGLAVAGLLVSEAVVRRNVLDGVRKVVGHAGLSSKY